MRAHIVAPRIPETPYLPQEVNERRHTVARFFRKICAGIERQMIVGRQKNGERPAAAAAGGCEKGELVNLVDVRAVPRIPFYTNVQFVHRGSGGFIFEAFVRHHVPPVTGAVADGQKNGLVQRARLSEGGWTPRPPVDGIVGVLAKVWTTFSNQVIRHARRLARFAARKTKRPRLRASVDQIRELQFAVGAPGPRYFSRNFSVTT